MYCKLITQILRFPVNINRSPNTTNTVKTSFLSKITILAAGMLFLQTASAFSQTYHPYYLDDPASWEYLSGETEKFTSDPTPNEATWGSELGSWKTDASNASLEIDLAGLFGSFTVSDIDAIEVRIGGSGTSPYWGVTLYGTEEYLNISEPMDADGWVSVNETALFSDWSEFKIDSGNEEVDSIRLSLYAFSGDHLNLNSISFTVKGRTEVLVFAGVPEPGSIALLLGSAGGLLLMGHRRMARRRA